MGFRSLVVCAVLVAAAQAAAAPPEKDDAGRTIGLKGPVEHVFPAGPPATLDLYIVAPDKMLGWTRGMKPKDASFIPDKYVDLPMLGRLTGRGGDANLEDVVKEKPDLVLDVGDLGATYVSLADRVQQQTGIPYALFDGSLAATPATLKKLGATMGVDADALATYAQDTLTTIHDRAAHIADADRRHVYLARGPKGLETDKAGSINGQSIEFVGAINVAQVPIEGGNLMDVSMEQVLTWQPDTILVYDPQFFSAVWSDPLWQKVKAVTDRRVYLIPSQPVRWVDEPPAGNRLIGLRWLAKLLYPALYPDDMRDEVRRFYELFYHRAPSDQQIDALLTAAAPPK